MAFTPGPDMRGYVYTDDEGHDWVLRAKRENAEYTDASGNVTDFTVYTGQPTNGAMPTNFKPRTVTVANTTHGQRKLVCFTTDARLWLGTATSTQMRASDGTVVTYSRIGQNAEKRRKPIFPET